MSTSAREKLMHVLYVLVRSTWVILNQMYAIPTYLVWMLTLRPLKWYNFDMYYHIESFLFHGLLHMVAYWMWTAGYTITEEGDDLTECLNDESLLLINHQATGDIPTIMSLTASKGVAVNGNTMWIMDLLFKWTNFGMVSQVHGDFFILQGRDTRHLVLKMLEKHLRDVYIPRERKWIILYPEGGFLYKRREKSQSFAKKNDLPVLEHVTLPRVGAMKTVCDVLSPCSPTNNGPLSSGKQHRTLRWVIDITVAYPEGKPLGMWTIGTGTRAPCVTKLYCRKFPVSEIPLDTEGMTQWLYQVYVEKEALLDACYKTGSYPVLPQMETDSGGSFLKKPRLLAIEDAHLIFVHVVFFLSTLFHWKILCAVYGLFF